MGLEVGAEATRAMTDDDMPADDISGKLAR